MTLKCENPNSYRVIGDMSGSDQIMNSTFFLGTYPGLTNKMIQFEIESIGHFLHNFRNC